MIDAKKEFIRIFYPEKYDRIQKGKCPECNKLIKTTDFKDEESIYEFEISALCQFCQDKLFIKKGGKYERKKTE